MTDVISDNKLALPARKIGFFETLRILLMSCSAIDGPL